jgi:hypothetical protein
MSFMHELIGFDCFAELLCHVMKTTWHGYFRNVRVSERAICSDTPWHEQVIFWWDDDVCFVLDQHARLNF